MPPEQCPTCGRFLSRAFVAAATAAPLPCPRCAAAIHIGASSAPASSGTVAPGTVAANSTEDVVAAVSRHPLDDWDSDGGATRTSAADRTIALAPEQIAVIGAGAALGATLVGRGRRLVGAVLGAVAGYVVTRLRD